MNVILLVIDALRADHLGCYGYDRNTSPNIDDIAKKSVIFENAFSCSNATDPSFTTIFSGKYPVSHGIRGHSNTVTNTQVQSFYKQNITFLSERLRDDSGYETLGIDWLGRWHKKGFEYYLGEEEQSSKKVTPTLRIAGKITNRLPNALSERLRRICGLKKRNMIHNATKMVDKSIDLIGDYDHSKPFFLSIHFWDTHTPYNAPKEIYEEFKPENDKQDLARLIDEIGNEQWRNNLKRMFAGSKTVEEVISKYDSAIRYVDHEIGRLVDFLKKSDLFDETIFIITSDHGESLTEHGILFDHHGLYDESIKVPLILSNVPVSNNKKFKSFIQHVDIAPTVLDLLSIPFEESDFDGMSLVPLMEEKLSSLRSFIVAEERYTENKTAIRTDEWKYIYSPSKNDAKCRYCDKIHGGTEELYHLNSDPYENHNIVEAEPEIAEKLKEQLFKFIKHLEHKKIEQEETKISKKIKDLKFKDKI